MPKEETQFKPGNKEAAKKKGKQHRSTQIKKKIENWAKVEGLVEKNILEALQSRNKKDRMYATRYFAEFVKPKKRESSIEVKEPVTVKIVYKNDDKKPT